MQLIFRNKECGATDLIAAALLMPILLALFVATFDLARVPMGRASLRTMVSDSVRAALDQVAADSGSPIVDNFGLAGTAYDRNIDVGALGGVQDFITATTAQKMVNRSCTIAERKLNLSAGFLNSGAFNTAYAFQFAIIKTSSDDFASGNPELIAASVDSCGGSQLFSSFVASESVDYARIAKHILTRYSDSSNALWKVSAYSPGSDSAATLSSYWFIGIGYTKMTYVFDKVWGTPPIFSEYYVQPFGTPLGIQTSSAQSS